MPLEIPRRGLPAEGPRDSLPAMSERLTTCKALAAMIQAGGQPTVDEMRFIAHIALELGLSDADNKAVQSVLSSGGAFEDLVAQIKDPEMRVFLFRQVVAAALIDDHINDAEHSYINKAATAFGISAEHRAAFIAWMHEGMDWERRGAALLAAMKN